MFQSRLQLKDSSCHLLWRLTVLHLLAMEMPKISLSIRALLRTSKLRKLHKGHTSSCSFTSGALMSRLLVTSKQHFSANLVSADRSNKHVLKRIW